MSFQRPASARIVFDEAHAEAWTVRPEIARAIQPTHPQDSSYARAAELLRTHDLDVAVHESGALDADALRGIGADVVVIAHPSEPAWEQVVPGGSPRFGEAELDALEAFVDGGGGLIVLGEQEQAKYGNNVNELLSRFGIEIENRTVSDYEHHLESPHWIRAELADATRHSGVDLLARVEQAVFYRATTLHLTNGARVLARTSKSASEPQAPLLAVSEHGKGRVVVLGDSDLFGDDCIDDLDHADLWLNLVHWAAAGAFAQPLPVEQQAADARDDAHWRTLKAEVDALRLQQQPDGAVDLSQHDADELRAASSGSRRRSRG